MTPPNILHPTLPIRHLTNVVMSAMSIVAPDGSGITIEIDRLEGTSPGHWCAVTLSPVVLREMIAAVADVDRAGTEAVQ